MWGEGGVAGSQPMNTAVHMEAKINFGDLTPYLIYANIYSKKVTYNPALALSRIDLLGKLRDQIPGP
jgi:hypothetical protein